MTPRKHSTENSWKLILLGLGLLTTCVVLNGMMLDGQGFARAKRTILNRFGARAFCSVDTGKPSTDVTRATDSSCVDGVSEPSTHQIKTGIPEAEEQPIRFVRRKMRTPWYDPLTGHWQSPVVPLHATPLAFVSALPLARRMELVSTMNNGAIRRASVRPAVVRPAIASTTAPGWQFHGTAFTNTPQPLVLASATTAPLPPVLPLLDGQVNTRRGGGHAPCW